MPRGPKGEKRPADEVSTAIKNARCKSPMETHLGKGTE